MQTKMLCRDFAFELKGILCGLRTPAALIDGVSWIDDTMPLSDSASMQVKIQNGDVFDVVITRVEDRP